MRELAFVSSFSLIAIAAVGCTSSGGGGVQGSAGMQGQASAGVQGQAGTRAQGQAGTTSVAGAGTGGTTGGVDGGTGGTTGGTGGGGTGAPDGATTDGLSTDAPTQDAPLDSGSKADAAAETGGGLTAAMIKATCPMYKGSQSFSAPDFCTLFLATCMSYIDYEPLTGCAAGPSLWAQAYATWTTTQKNCRSQHLCAAASGNASTECHSAQPVTGQCP